MGPGLGWSWAGLQIVLGLDRAWIYKTAQLELISTNEPSPGPLCFTDGSGLGRAGPG